MSRNPLDPRQRLPLHQRLIVSLMTRVERGVWRNQISRDFVEEIVRRNGLSGLGQLSALDKIISTLTSRFGEADAQTLLAFASLRMGCTYCSRAHLFTANLLRFAANGELFPISEADMATFMDERPAGVLALLRQRLGGRHDRMLALLERQYALEQGAAEGETADDKFLTLASKGWAWMTECSIITFEDPVFFASHATTKMALDPALQQRYASARASA